MLLFSVARRPCVGKERLCNCHSGAFEILEISSFCSTNPSADSLAKDSRQFMSKEAKSCLQIEPLCKESPEDKSK